jgi:hypothetical protein
VISELPSVSDQNRNRLIAVFSLLVTAAVLFLAAPLDTCNAPPGGISHADRHGNTVWVTKSGLLICSGAYHSRMSVILDKIRGSDDSHAATPAGINDAKL